MLYVCGYTQIQILVYSQLHIDLLESKLDIVVTEIDFVSYYHLSQIIPFLIASHII